MSDKKVLHYFVLFQTIVSPFVQDLRYLLQLKGPCHDELFRIVISLQGFPEYNGLKINDPLLCLVS